MDDVVVIEVPVQPVDVVIAVEEAVLIEVPEQGIDIVIPPDQAVCLEIGIPGPVGPLPGATAVGQVLISTDGVIMTAEQPAINDDGFWPSNDEGQLLVLG